MAKATFGAGCFWGVEHAFRQVSGVIGACVGYTGGNYPNPTYHDVCADRTGHTEAVEIEYDPSLVSYEQLLDIFWQIHDPTTLNRQGPDFGSQYRSTIFFHSPEQEATAKASMQRAQSNFKRPIVTQIVPAPTFYRAEEYHQRYFEKHGLSHCAI